MMHEYELVTVTRGDLSEAARAGLMDQIKKIVFAEKGEVTDINDWGRRELAYDIKKNSSGFYTALIFRGNSNTPGIVSSKIKLFEELLRFLIVRKESSKPADKESKPEVERGN